jgi:CubicO group peptidase (beta-lactamase class C family)
MTGGGGSWTLAERGRSTSMPRFSGYVSYYPTKPWPITVRQLLGHLGGIPHYVNRDDEQHITVHKTTREAVAIFAGYELVAEPGTRSSYSSYGYNLLGAALEGVTGRGYGDVMRDLVWGPLGMASVQLDDPYRLIDNRVRGYRLVDGELRNSEFHRRQQPLRSRRHPRHGTGPARFSSGESPRAGSSARRAGRLRSRR